MQYFKWVGTPLPISQRRSGLKISKVRFIVAHDTGDANATVNNEISYMVRTRNDEKASAHIFVDDRTAWECIPVFNGAPEKAWHVHYNAPLDNMRYGDDANDCAIGVELCYGPKLNSKQAYTNYVYILAKICDHFGLNPKTDIISHMELDPKRRTDPENAMRTIGKHYPKDLINDVSYVFNTEFKGKVMEGEDVDAVKIIKPDNTEAQGIILASKSYIKVSDLTSLGFNVTWDAETRTVKIDKK